MCLTLLIRLFANPCQINAQETQIQKAEATITTLQGEMQNMRSKVEEALTLIDVVKKLEDRIVSVQHRQGPTVYLKHCFVSTNLTEEGGLSCATDRAKPFHP